MNPGYHVADLEHYSDAVSNLRRRCSRALSELHPDLRMRVGRLVDCMDGQVMPWTGFRDEEAQNAAWLAKRSEARWLSSPHNYKPALACDLVLNPARVNVRERLDAPGWPDLWDQETAEAQHAWEDMHRHALRLGLERVKIGRREGHPRWDRPHVQLPGWRKIAGLTDGD